MKIKTALSTSALIGLLFASTVSAQDTNVPTINQPNQAPTGGNLNEENAPPAGTVTQDENSGFNPLWLLPLALLPLLYFMFKKTDRGDVEETRSGRYETAYHDIDREEELEDIDDDDDLDNRGRGWFDDSDEHSDAARRGKRRFD